MNDYLWDKTGEPDREIEQLEELLGELRYQPSELKLPTIATPLRIAPIEQRARDTFTPRMAVAATLAFLALAGGLWLSLRSRSGVQENNTPFAHQNNLAPYKEAVKPRDALSENSSAKNQPQSPPEPNKNYAAKVSTAQSSTPHRKIISRLQPDSMSAKASEIIHARREQAERARGEQAKDQLIMALRLASAKLNLAQKKVQGKPETVSSHS
jgi:hypothetical protein